MNEEETKQEFIKIEDAKDWHKRELQSIIQEWHESKMQKNLIEIIRERLK